MELLSLFNKAYIWIFMCGFHRYCYHFITFCVAPFLTGMWNNVFELSLVWSLFSHVLFLSIFAITFNHGSHYMLQKSFPHPPILPAMCLTHFKTKQSFSRPKENPLSPLLQFSPFVSHSRVLISFVLPPAVHFFHQGP